MTIERLLYDISEISLKNNLVNAAYAGPSIYNINGATVLDYPYLFTSPTDDITVGENTTRYGLTLYYVDRLLSDSSNEVDIFSTGVETLKNIIRQLELLDEIVDVTDEPIIRLFTETQRMADSCAGAYCRLSITALNTAACPVYFDETGAPLGTYIPSVIKDQNVLENLASKNWVIQYIADHGSGVDEKEVKKLIKQELRYYTKTSDFATINGSGITSGETYNLVERDYFNEFLSAYTQDVSDIYSAISAATPEDYTELRDQVSANTENICTLSGATENIGSGLSELSGVTAQIGDDLQSLSGTVVGNIDKIADISGATDQNASNIEALSGATTALSQQVLEQYHAIETLSGQSSSITQEIAVLSGFTEQAVSSLTLQVETLSGATSDALAGIYSGMSGMADDIEALSGSAVSMEAQISAITANDNVVIFDLRKYGTGSTVVAELYNAMSDAYYAGKQIFLVAYVSEHTFGESNPAIAPANVYISKISGEDHRPQFYFGFTTSIPGLPEEILVSNPIWLRPSGISGCIVHDYDNEVYYMASVDWTINRMATDTKYGAVKFGSGVTHNSTGTINVAIGSGLTYDAEGNVTNPYTGNVESQSVTKIWSGSLAAYQALGTYSNDTLYLII